jgi:hypothetical protein
VMLGASLLLCVLRPTKPPSTRVRPSARDHARRLVALGSSTVVEISQDRVEGFHNRAITPLDGRLPESAEPRQLCFQARAAAPRFAGGSSAPASYSLVARRDQRQPPHPRQNSPVHSSGYCMQLPTISRGARWLRLQLAALCLTSSSVAIAYKVPSPPDAVAPPPKQTLVVQLQSKLNGADRLDYKRMMPVHQYWVFDPPLVERLRTASGECVIVMLHFFDDGSMRPTGQLLDETCLVALTDWKELRTNGTEAEFNAHTPNGTVEVWLSARWMNPPSQGLTDLMRAELAELPQLSPEQAQQQARQRDRLVRAMKADAVDRAWRAARRAP